MKTWFITLPFLCVTGIAMAQGVGQEEAADPPAVSGTPAASEAAQDQAEAPKKAKASSRGRMAKHKPKSLPKGDMRHCLDLKTRAEIIRCSETRPKK